jgi:glycosyltransferase involved in cell wall biosynthesis
MSSAAPVPSVSIVVPAHNAEATIASCVTSLLELDYPRDDYEIIVVDNGSGDQTAGILQSFGEAIRVVEQARPGPAAARNAGIEAARGELIALTDADCRVDRGWLRELLPPLADPEVGIVGGRVRALPPLNRVSRFGEVIHDHQRAIERLIPPYVATANWGSRRQLLVEQGLFDPSLLRGSDAELALRIGRRGYRLVYQEGAIVYHPHQATLWGLFSEGRAHGRGSAMIKQTGRHNGIYTRRRRFGFARRILRNSAQALRGPERFTALCQVIFDLGKVTGRMAETLPLTRSRARGGGAA